MSLSLKTLLASTACLALVACGGGSSGGGSGGGGGVSDTVAPTVSFNPTTLTVEGGSTGSSTLTATDNVGVSSNTVNCTNGGTFSNNTFTAPDVDTQTESVCTATARDAAGNSASATLTVTIDPAPDTEPPSISISTPNSIVPSGGSTDLVVEVTDNRGSATFNVECNLGSWVNGIYTAPTVTAETTDTCTVTAEDDAGNISTDTIDLTIQEPDTTDPVISFPNGNTLTVNSSGTVDFPITVTDNSGETITPSVSCDNGGSWANGVFTAPTVTVVTTVTCIVEAEDAAFNLATDSFTVTVNIANGKVTLSGTATFDFVPHNTTTNGLDYANTSRKPIRGATVQLVNNAGTILEVSKTADDGTYSFELDPNLSLRVRILSEITSDTGAIWDVKVANSANDVYALQGAVASIGDADSERDLHAPSGWGGSSYTSTRTAAPFAILDPIFTTVNKFAEVDPDINFPQLFIDWSPQNNTGSFYDGTKVTLLGDENNDTDEYDAHVVVHEWGHYFENQLSRADSIGGQHTGGDRLDPRIAFGEGFGYAIAAIILDDPNARDSGGAGQSGGFNIPVDRNNSSNPGWFSEASIQSILYDLYDAPPDGADNVEAGLAPIYETLISADYTGSPYFTTIFLFRDEYNKQNSGTSAGLDALVSAQTINGTGPDGSGESNTGSISGSTPVYKTITAGATVNFCSVNDAGTYNKLGNRNYLEFTPAATGSFTMTMSRTSGAASTDPDIAIYNSGTFVTAGESSTNNSETLSASLLGGTTYIIDAYDWNNVGNATQGATPGDACFDFSIN